jgi:hypothetical protein
MLKHGRISSLELFNLRRALDFGAICGGSARFLAELLLIGHEPCAFNV